MPLRNFVSLFVRQRRLFLAISLTGLVCGLAVYRLQGQSYETTILLSVTRRAALETNDYQYAHFYRLQADERFADTLVRYLETPQAERALLGAANVTAVEVRTVHQPLLHPVRLSSQLVSVTYRTRSFQGAGKVADALPQIANAFTDDLNREAHASDWFTLVSSDPVITDGRFSWRLALGAGFALGAMVAFWVVLMVHFWQVPLSSASQAEAENL